MKRFCRKLVPLLTAIFLATQMQAANKYWDIDGTTSGSGPDTTPDGNWDTGTTANWNTVSGGTGAATTWTANDDAFFSAGTDGSGTFIITIPTSVSVNSVSVEEGTITFNTGTLTLTGVGGLFDVASGATASFAGASAGFLGGAVGLTKTGTGTLNLGGSETYTGNSLISAGTILISSSSSQNPFGGAGASTITFNGGSLSTGSGASATLKAGYAVTLGASGGTFGAASSQSLTLNGKITGVGKFVKGIGGTVNLVDTTSDFSGGIEMNSGVLAIGSAAALGPTTETITFTGNSTLSYSGSGSLSIGATRTITINSGITATIQNTASGSTLTVNGKITGAGNLQRSTAGTSASTLIISGAANDYTGTTTLTGNATTAGTTKNGANNALPTTTIVTINTPGIWDLNGFDQTIAGLTGSGTVINNVAGTKTLTISASSAQSFSGLLSSGTGILNLVKRGSSSLTLSTANTYAGTTTLSAGTLVWNNNAALGGTSGSPGSGPTVTINDANTGSSDTFLNRNAAGTLPNNIVVADLGTGTVTIGNDTANASVNYSGTVTLNRSVSLRGGGATGTCTFTGGIAGDGGVTIVAGTAGSKVRFNTTANTYDGDTTIASSAVLQLLAANLIPDGSDKGNVALTGTLDLNTFSDTINGLSGVGTVDTLAGGSPTLTVGNDDVTSSFSGVIKNTTGTLNLTKTGIGTLTLSGANTYTGNTSISQGTLLINSPGSLAAGSAVSVATSATLGGSGTINGPVTVNSGGTLAPGASIGQLTLTLAPSLNAVSTNDMEINKAVGPVLTADELVVSSGGGTLTYAGTLKVTATGDALDAGDSFDLFDGDASASPMFSGGFTTFDLPALTAGLQWDTSQLTVNGSISVVCNPATANAGADQTVCASSPNVTLAGSIGGSATTGTWSGGAGTFNPNSTTLNAVYTPTAGEITSGTVTLTLTTDDPTAACTGAANDSMTITINPVATVTAGADQLIQSGNNATLAGSFDGGASSASWSGGTGSYNPDANTPTAVYTPSAGEVNAGTVTLTLTTDNPSGPCDAAADSVVITINRLPSGGSDSLSTATNTPASITVNKLKNFHPDADGDSLTFALVSGTTTQSGTVSESSGTVTYEPPGYPSSTFEGADSFQYTLDDGRGGIATITVNVTVGSGTAQGANSVLVFTDTTPDPDQFVVRFAGVPGVDYTVEHSTTATGPWSKLENKTAPTDNSLGFGIGVFEVRENIDASGAGFYRTVYPSY